MIDVASPALSSIGERALLSRLRARIPRAPDAIVGIGDDAAALRTTETTLITTDVLVERVHFRREWAAADAIGWKAIAVNVSDIAAMGGTPTHATVSLCLPPDTTVRFVDELYDGVLAAAKRWGVGIVGGNVASTQGPVVIDVALLGRAEGDRIVRRSTIRSGDLLFATGSLGAAAAGWRALDRYGPRGPSGKDDALRSAFAASVEAQVRPRPPAAFGAALGAARWVRGAIDLSDGLSSDLAALCEESGVAAEIAAESLPISAPTALVAADLGIDPLALALHGGEDYQLLIAVEAGAEAPLRSLAASHDAVVTELGVFREGPPSVTLLRGSERQALPRSAFEHFCRGEAPA